MPNRKVMQISNRDTRLNCIAVSGKSMASMHILAYTSTIVSEDTPVALLHALVIVCGALLLTDAMKYLSAGPDNL